MTTSLDKDKSAQSQEMVEVPRGLLKDLLSKMKRSKHQRIKLQNDLVDILEQVKVVHQITVNDDTGHSPYEDDPRDALFSAVSFLREKTHQFQQSHDIYKITVPEALWHNL